LLRRNLCVTVQAFRSMFLCTNCLKPAAADEAVAPSLQQGELKEIADLLRARDLSFQPLRLKSVHPVAHTAPFLAEALVNASPSEDREHAAQALQELGPEGVALAKKELHQAVLDSSITVQAAAVAALKTHGWQLDNSREPTEIASEMPNSLCTTPPHEEHPDLPSFKNKQEFELSLQKKNESDRWGIDVDDCHGKFLEILQVTKGLVCEWNRNQLPARIVREGDFIVEINGVSADSTQMMKLLQTCRSITVRIQKCSF